MSDIKVSVIIPVYNGGQAFKKCLYDVMNQTLKDIEIICVDDGSTDESAQIISQAALEDSRIHYVYQNNQGAAVARNKGMEYATGEYVSFLDADDFYEAEMLEKAYINSVKHDVDICIFRGNKYDASSHQYLSMDYALRFHEIPCNPFTYKDISDNVFHFCVGWAWDKLYRRQFIIDEKLSFQNLRTSNDLFFVFSSLVKAKKIYALNELLIHHRVNDSLSLSVTREKSWNCFYLAANALKQELERIGKYHEVEKSFVNWYVHFSFWNLDTIEGDAYKKVYELIKYEILPSLHLEQYPAGFLSTNYVKRVFDVQSYDCDEYVYEQFFKLRKKAKQKSDDGAKRIKNSKTYKVGKIVLFIPLHIKKWLKRRKK